MIPTLWVVDDEIQQLSLKADDIERITCGFFCW